MNLIPKSRKRIFDRTTNISSNSNTSNTLGSFDSSQIVMIIRPKTHSKKGRQLLTMVASFILILFVQVPVDTLAAEQKLKEKQIPPKADSTNTKTETMSNSLNDEKIAPSMSRGKIESSSSSLNTNNINHHRNTHSNPNKLYKTKREKREKKQKAFIKWCQTTLGIQTLLEIQEFEYENYIQVWKDRLRKDNDYLGDVILDYYNDWDESYRNRGNNVNRGDDGSDISSSSYISKNNENHQEQQQPSKTILVRGLAASRDIDIDEIIISVPYHALITIQTTIDHDPVLSQILGPKARLKYGWLLSSSQKVGNKKEYKSDQNNNMEETSSKTIKDMDSRIMRDSSSNFSASNEKDNDILPDDDLSAASILSDKDSSYYEIGLLTVALLYHRSLGELSPIWFHIDTLLDGALSGINNIPLLWNFKKLQKEFDGVEFGPAGDEVRRLVLTMKKDVKMMYDEIMGILVKDHKEIFGRPELIDDSNNTEDVDDNVQNKSDKKEWMFSYEKFEWAFAIVNSRKWHLPLADLDQDSNRHHKAKQVMTMQETTGSASINSMPAQQPTDEYMTKQDEVIRLEYSDENIFPRPAPSLSNKDMKSTSMKHTFMAPLADMLNFGRECAKGRYNTESKMFEVIATCKFLKGQEVTFWYSDDCENVMLANYGFTHPLIPKCLSAEDWQHRSELWRKHALSLEKNLDSVYEELYDTLTELKGCDCGDNNDSINNININSQDEHISNRDIDSKKETQININDNSAVGEDGHSGIRRTKPRDHEQDEMDL